MVTGLAVVFLVAGLLQPPAGTLVISVVDEKERAMPGTLVTLSGPAERRGAADANGVAQFGHLPPGRYELEVALSGFATYHATVDVALTETRHRVTLKFVGSFDPRRGRYVVEQIVTGCDVPPPPTLEALWREVPVVARVRVAGQRTSLVEPGAELGHLVTASQLEPLEVFKAAGDWRQRPSVPEVVQPGGELDRGAYLQITSQPSFTLLRPHSEYVLFLQRSEPAEWTAAYCAAGALMRDGERVKTEGWSDLARTWNQKPWEALLTRLRALAAR